MLKQVTIVLLLVVGAGACVAHAPVVVPTRASTQAAAVAEPAMVSQVVPGVSGMARFDADTYIVVQDKKSFETGGRLGLITVDKASSSIRYRELAFPVTGSGRTSDLESVCRLRGRPGEFLLAESGYWEGQNGRLFHVAIRDATAVLERVLKLPFIRNNGPRQRDGDNFEGLACIPTANDTYTVLLGERGGSAHYPIGVIRWGTYDARAGAVTWSGQQIAIEAPNPWNDPTLRSIASLSIDSTNQLWATATSDGGDLGPFRSLVYRVGTVSANPNRPVTLARDTLPRQIDGFKVEGLVVDDATAPFIIGTEDEELGGTWRPVTR
ncbi:MAG: hypothetical protein AAGH76_03520 [Pseudomonadota bacterium]